MKEVTWQAEFSIANLSHFLRSNVRLVYTTPGKFENRGYQIMFYVHNTPEKTRQSSVILNLLLRKPRAGKPHYFVISPFSKSAAFKMFSVHMHLWPLHMSRVTGLARLPGRMVCLYGQFHPGQPRWNSRNKTNIVEHKLLSFLAVVVLWTLVTLLTKVIRILLKWKYIQDKNYAILAAMLRKQSYFV